MALNEKTDFTTISIRYNTSKTLLKQLWTEVIQRRASLHQTQLHG